MYCAMPSRLRTAASRAPTSGSGLPRRLRRLGPRVHQRTGLSRYAVHAGRPGGDRIARRPVSGGLRRGHELPGRAGEGDGVTGEVGGHVVGVDLVAAGALAVRVVVLEVAQPALDEHRVALAEAPEDVVGELPPARHGDVEGVPVDPLVEGPVEPARRGRDP